MKWGKGRIRPITDAINNQINMGNLKFLRIAVLVVLVVSPAVFAQVRIGAKIGYSIGKIADNSDNIYTEDFKSTEGVDFGVLAEFQVSELFSVQGELLYTQRGGKRNGFQPIPVAPLESALMQNGITLATLNQIIMAQGGQPITDSNPLYADFNNVSDLNYLEIPILAKLGWGKDWRFYVELGPYVGFLLSADQRTSGESAFYLDADGRNTLKVPNPFHDPQNPATGPPFVDLPPQSFDEVTDVKDDLNSVNFGFHTGAGLIRRLSEHHEVFLSFRGSYGLIPLQKDEVFGESHIGGLVFSFGYAYTL